MTYAFSITLIVLLAAVMLGLGWRTYQNHEEIMRLRRNGYRRLAMRRYRRGSVEPGLLQALAELSLLVMLLVAVLGWMGVAGARW